MSNNVNSTINQKSKPYFTNERKARLLPSLLLAIGIPFMFFIVSPLEIYSNGLEEFTFGLSDFIWVMLLFFFGCVLIFFSLLFFTPKIFYRVFYAFLLALFLLLFLQLNFLNGSLSSLAGDDTGKTQVATSLLVLNTILWILLTGAFITAFLTFKKRDIKGIICLMLSFALVASQLINFFIVIASTSKNLSPYDKLLKEDKDFVPTFLTEQYFTTVSENKNVIIFCIDRFDAELFADPSLENETLKEYYEKLNGFTYYDDNISMYPRTYPSVCYMLTNIENDGVNAETTRKEYLNYAYLNNKTMSKLSQEGYTVDVYTEVFDSFYNAYYMPEYVRNKETTSLDNVYKSVSTLDKFRLGINMTKISAYRNFPYILKDLFGSVSSSTCNEVVKMKSNILGYNEYTNDMKSAYENVTKENAFVKENTVGSFKFIHLTGCHNVPYDEDWEKTGSLSNGDIFVSLKHSLEIVTEYIDNLKTLGVYDDATIIITGDHSSVSNESGSGDGNYCPLEKERLTALFVKKSGVTEGNPLTNRSHKPVSHEDLWKTIFDSENITSFDSSISGYSVFDTTIPDENRNRHYVFYQWNNFLHSEYTEYYYEITGNGRDFENWQMIEEKTKDYSRGYYD